MKERSKNTTTFLFTLLTGVLVVTAFISYYKIRQFNKSVDWVMHTQVVKDNIIELRANIKDAETDQRGYLITNDSAFLQRFHGSEQRNNLVFATLDSLISDDAVQQENLNKLKALFDERYFLLNENMNLLKNKHRDSYTDAALLIDNNKMVEVRKQIVLMLQTEDTLLQQRIQVKDRSATIIPIFLLLLSLFSIVALTLFFFRLQKETNLRVSTARLVEVEAKARKQIEESEAKFRNLISQAPVAITTFRGPSLIIETINKKALEIWGKSYDQVINKPFLESNPEAEDELKPIFNQVYTIGKPFVSNETPIQLERNGKTDTFYFNAVHQPLRDLDNKIYGIISVATDVTENVNARKQIEKMAMHLTLATDSANVGTWSFDIKTQKLEWSAVHKRMWGYDEHRKDLEYEDWYKIILPEDKENAFKKAEEARVNNTVTEAKYYINRANDGALRYMHSFGKYYYNDKGEAVTLTGICIDISEQKEAEEKIKESREILETTLQNVPSAIYHFDKTGKILFLNEIGANQIGYATTEEVLAEKDIFQLRKGVDETFNILNEQGNPLPVDQSSAALTFKTGKYSEIVSQFIYKKTGASFWLLSKSSPLFDEKGRLFKVLTNSTDITLQKISEQTLRESEEKFRTLAETLPHLVWITNEKGEYEYASGQWKEYSGLDPHFEETWQQLVHPDDLKAMMDTWEKSLSSGQTYVSEVRLKNKEGEYRWHVVQGEAIKNNKGEIVKWIGAFTDIHAQKTVEEKIRLLNISLEEKVKSRTEELHEKNIQLELANAELASFSYVASHDLKEPLRKIQTFSKLVIETEKFSGKTQDYFNRIITSGERMQNLIDSLLNFSHVKTTELIFEKCVLNTIVEESKSDLSLKILEKQAIIEYENLPTINGVYIQLSQLFTNLIDNGIKYSRPEINPHIKITSSIMQGKKIENPRANPEKQYHAIKIADNGIGFENEYANKIFEPFQRLHSKNEFSGTGIGLAIVKKTLTNHNGFIVADSNPGIGSTFTIYIPTA